MYRVKEGNTEGGKERRQRILDTKHCWVVPVYIVGVTGILRIYSENKYRFFVVLYLSYSSSSLPLSRNIPRLEVSSIEGALVLSSSVSPVDATK